MAINLTPLDENENIPIEVSDGSPYYVGARAYVTRTAHGAVLTVIDKYGQTTARIDDGKSIAAVIANADYTITVLLDDGTSVTTAPLRGEKGNGIVSIEKTGTSGLVDTYTMTLDDGTFTYEITNGAKGDTGNGIENAVLNGDYTLTLDFSDGTSYTTPPIRGARGNGIMSVTKTSTSELVDTYTITYDDGDTETFNVTNGSKGDKGDKGDTGNGIESVELTSTVGYVKTYTITFTDGSTTTFDVTDGEVSEEILNEKIAKILPQDSASGSIASFPDGSDLLPAKSLKVSLDPIQDLHGYDKPWSGGNGKNKIDYLSCVGVGARNDTDSVSASVSVSSDVVTLTGGASYRSGGQIFKGIGSPSITGAFTVSADVKCTADTVAFGVGAYEGGGTSDVIANYDVTANTWTHISRTFTDKTYAKMGIFLQPKVGEDVLEVKNLQLELGSTATPYEPYSNECPISGRTEVVTQRTGVNVWDEVTEIGYISNATGENASAVDQIRGKNYISVKPNTSYYFKSPNGVFVYFYGANKEYIGVYSGGTRVRNSTLTLGSDVYYIRISMPSDYGTTYNHDISINYPSTDTDYHAYQGTTYTTDLGRTVYGGTPDVVSGELVVDRVMVDLGSLNWNMASTLHFRSRVLEYRTEGAGWDGDWQKTKSNVFVCENPSTAWASRSVGSFTNIKENYYNFDVKITDGQFADATEFKTWLSSVGAVVCIELAEPQTYQLTPQEINLLQGENNVWSDGDVTVVYSADIQRYIEKKLG